ncbi:uncharacterized protein LAJ45_03569 [Morchella importuna]|uniref:uncharacterized protein n=1 Tax=Morchella importuna TaxID=1174673 RepID=UPI001E8CF0C5|nr:uncharacterized protein LAJ45_03569 [Morchella importuna]KAH8152143.1 hypothetical protein LAJ45_03569 [Morchella importuna]
MSLLTTTDQSRDRVPDPAFLAELIAQNISLKAALVSNRREQLTSTRNLVGCLHEIDFIKGQLRQLGNDGPTAAATVEEGDELVVLILEDLIELQNLRDDIEDRKDTASRKVMALEKEILELSENINYQKGLIYNSKEEKKHRKRDCRRCSVSFIFVEVLRTDIYADEMMKSYN